MTARAIYSRLFVSCTSPIICRSSRAAISVLPPFGPAGKSTSPLLAVRSSHVGTSFRISAVPIVKTVQWFSFLKCYATSSEGSGSNEGGDSSDDPMKVHLPKTPSAGSRENVKTRATESQFEGHDINDSCTVGDHLDSELDSFDSGSISSGADPRDVTISDDLGENVARGKNESPQKLWPDDDGIVIYTDKEFLTKRQQKTQQKETSLFEKKPSSSDQYNLRSLLENIQRQQDELQQKKERVARTTMMSVEELVEFLREDNARDICVIAVKPEMDYVDYFVLCTGTGSRHIGRMADHLADELKQVRIGPAKRRVRVEGRTSHDWMAVDLGTMVVHFLQESKREQLELEKLWCLGEEYDDQCRAMAKNYQDVLAMDKRL